MRWSNSVASRSLAFGAKTWKGHLDPEVPHITEVANLVLLGMDHLPLLASSTHDALLRSCSPSLRPLLFSTFIPTQLFSPTRVSFSWRHLPSLPLLLGRSHTDKPGSLPSPIGHLMPWTGVPVHCGSGHLSDESWYLGDALGLSLTYCAYPCCSTCVSSPILFILEIDKG